MYILHINGVTTIRHTTMRQMWRDMDAFIAKERAAGRTVWEYCWTRAR